MEGTINSYPDLVRLFYAYRVHDAKTRIETTVQGRVYCLRRLEATFATGRICSIIVSSIEIIDDVTLDEAASS